MVWVPFSMHTIPGWITADVSQPENGLILRKL